MKTPQSILYLAKALSLVSTKLTTDFALKLFTTPLKHTIPNRELAMDANSRQELITIPALGKKVNLYHYGTSPTRILLVHGWSGRGTQLSRIAEQLLEAGYSTLSFDAPAHGKSPGTTSHMKEFVTTILYLQEKYGPFDSAIGHSLGAMACLNAAKRGLNVRKMVIIGSGDVVDDILKDFVYKLKLKSKIFHAMKAELEKRLQETTNSYSAYMAGKELTIPILVIHDTDDKDVPVAASKHIAANLQHGELIITKGLGHRKILGDADVIRRCIQFLKK